MRTLLLKAKTCCQTNPFAIPVYILSLLILFKKAWFLWTDPYYVTWDTYGHYHTILKMNEFLRTGSWQGYDWDWFGGFPLWTFYPPLYPLLVNGLYFLTLGKIPLLLWVNIFNFLNMALFIVLFEKAYRSIFRTTRVSALAILFANFFLYSSAYAITGLQSTVIEGLFINFFGFNLFLLFLIGFYQYLNRPGAWPAALLIVSLAASILNHLLSALFLFIFIFAQLLIARSTERKWEILLFVGCALALAGFWLLPFVMYVPDYSSGGAVMGKEYDLLAMILNFDYTVLREPAALLSLKHLAYLLAGGFQCVSLLYGFYLLKNIPADGPYKERYQCYFWMLIILLIVMSSSLIHFIAPDLPFHYYRWFPFVYILALLLSVYGGGKLMGVLAAKRFGNNEVFAFSLIAVVLLFTFANKYDRARRDVAYEKITDQPAYAEIQAIRDYLKPLKDSLRIFYEVPNSLSELTNTFRNAPHFPSFYFPSEGLPIINGLYVESSKATPYVYSAMSGISRQFIWGGIKSPAYPPQAALSLLETMGCRYLITYAKDLKHELPGNPDPTETLNSQKVQLLKTFGEYNLYRLTNSRPLVYYPDYTVVACYVKDQRQFKTFTGNRYSVDWRLNVPVIEIGKHDLEGLAAMRPQPRFILLNDNKPDEYISQYALENQVPMGGMKDLIRFLLSSKLLRYPAGAEPEYEVLSPHRLSIKADYPVIINLNYFPFWKTINGSSIFISSPAQMLAVPRGGRIEMVYAPYRDVFVRTGIMVTLLGAFLLRFLLKRLKAQELKLKTELEGAVSPSAVV